MSTLKLSLAAAAAVACAGAIRAEEVTADFEGEAALARWEIKGDAALDNAKARNGSSLRVAPGAQARLKLRAEDGSGTVKFWVFDDGTVPDDPKASRAGPHWGVVNAEGRILAIGPLYAKYLGGDKSYATGEYDPAKRQNPVWKPQHLGLPRKAEWREFTFQFDPDAGLKILVDGKDVNAQRLRFDWNKSEVAGFAGIVIVGDKKEGTAQTIWVDDITVTLGGPMNVKPAAPPAAPAAQ